MTLRASSTACEQWTHCPLCLCALCSKKQLSAMMKTALNNKSSDGKARLPIVTARQEVYDLVVGAWDRLRNGTMPLLHKGLQKQPWEILSITKLRVLFEKSAVYQDPEVTCPLPALH